MVILIHKNYEPCIVSFPLYIQVERIHYANVYSEIQWEFMHVRTYVHRVGMYVRTYIHSRAAR